MTPVCQFLREDLKYDDSKAKHKSFHRADLHISVEDMWTTWKNSEGENGSLLSANQLACSTQKFQYLTTTELIGNLDINKKLPIKGSHSSMNIGATISAVTSFGTSTRSRLATQSDKQYLYMLLCSDLLIRMFLPTC